MRFLLVAISLLFFIPRISNQEGKDTSIKLYEQEYKTSYFKSFKWNGSKFFCKAGITDSIYLHLAKQRINYFREIVGLPQIKFSSALNLKAQHAAFLMLKNDRLSHNPNDDWKCFNELSEDASRSSNIRFFDYFDYVDGGETLNPITGFVEDYGNTNNAVGHRRWILYSQLEVAGYGTTSNTEAIYISTKTKDLKKDELPEYIAYPPEGYITEDLVFTKWSFGIPDVYSCDFSKTKVSITDDSDKMISVKRFKPISGFGDPTLVWEIEGLFKKTNSRYIFRDKYLNKQFKVSIKNVLIDGMTKDFEYNVCVIPKP